MKRSNVIFAHHPPSITDPQLSAISELLRNLGLLILGLGVLPYIFNSVDKAPIGSVLLSLVIVALCWTIAIAIIRNSKL